ncbi:hypothetical protein ACVIIW_000047 [Bradyrhizobium sp. USDA 4449]
MAAIAIVALIAAFLPFIASLSGRGGIWKFLSFLFCCFSIGGAASVVGIGGGVLAWIIAWVFTALATSARRSEDRFARLERRMLAKQAAEVLASPVERLIVEQEAKQRFITPIQVLALVLVFGVAAALLVFSLNSDQQPTSARQDAATEGSSGFTDVSVKSESTAPNANAPKKASKPLEAVIVARADGTTSPSIVGVTNLPDDTKLLIGLRRKEANYFAQANAVVHGGQFRSEKFGSFGKPLPTGNYRLEITMPLAAVQPPSVQDVIGKDGERLTGKLVERSSLGLILTSVSTINIGGAPSRAADDAVRRENDAAMEKWRRDTCQQIAQISPGGATAAECVARLSQNK